MYAEAHAHFELFQSTPLNEGRLVVLNLGEQNNIISIHTPQRGATVKKHQKKSM